MDEEPDVTVEVHQGQDLIATKLFGSPATAGEVKQGLLEKNATWRGDLTPHNSSTSLVGQRRLKGGAVYHLHLQEQPAPSPRHSLLHPDDHQLEQAFRRVSGVTLEVEEAGKIINQDIGTIARIREDGLCASATHVWVKEGAMLPAVAFGGQVKLVASFPYYDVILLQASPGAAFQLPTGLRQPTVGTQVMMLAHAVAPKQDIRGLSEPTVSEGRIVAAAPTGELVAADYHAAMPSASGAPVLYDSRTFAGTHLGTSFHKDQTYADKEDEPEAPWDRVDLDPQSMWPSSTASGSSGTQAPRKRKPAQPAEPVADLEATIKQVHRLALHATSNIEHKDQLPLFVPAQCIIALATHVKALPPPAMHQAAKLSSK